MAKRKMTAQRAVDALGANEPLWAIKNMVRALGMATFFNTPDDNERLAAGKFALRHRRAFADECARRRNARHI